ncbi:hypothetical protein VC83_08805 [Pseudogymnoascus destructans]|uniref:Uncharacterized protein n=1 Tax=Pseudogymnoascus destructans TaxID=655981 RepID=A0A176ZXU4_9PEZI|nr:uncharacterized protein VC83_08805 [Pseudogymnoascus destructans]OAF54637.1 hypothetical protein VC83_08805 [Pseudogymnoascus destructans]
MTKGITNFFVRKQVYLAFFGWPTWRPTGQGGSHGRSPSLSPVPDFRDLPHGPSLDAQQHTVGSRTDWPPSALEPAEDDGGLFVPEAGPSQTQAEGMGDGGQPEQPTSSSTPAENERWKRKLLEHKKRREAWLERLDRERLEMERLEKERLEKERLEKERLERERLEREIDINLVKWEDDTWKYLTP